MKRPKSREREIKFLTEIKSCFDACSYNSHLMPNGVCREVSRRSILQMKHGVKFIRD